MKTKVIILITILLPLAAFSQIEGYWEGTLDLGPQQLELGFDIKNGDSLNTTLDVPAQGAYGIPAQSVIDGQSITISVSSIGARYQGTISGKTMTGTFSQRGVDFPLDLAKSEKQLAKKIRPQDPKEPFDYIVEDVSFENKTDGITLAGTLTMPKSKGPFPAVVLVSGSGAQNRDEELMEHKPFLVIADYLTRNGIAVLRYDDRGVAQSEGDASTATTADLANDAQAAFNYLLGREETDHDNIGIIGHSEGGMINFMVAAREQRVAFIISLAGLALKGSEILKQQQNDILKAQGFSNEAIAFSTSTNNRLIDIVEETKVTDSIYPRIEHVLKEMGLNEETIRQTTETLLSPWMVYFIKHDPTDDIVATQCPALLLNGTKDLQVSATQNLAAFKKIAKQHHKKNLVVCKMKGLNHLFQHCKNGLPTEYFEIEETIAPEALEKIRKFVMKNGR